MSSCRPFGGTAVVFGITLGSLGGSVLGASGVGGRGGIISSVELLLRAFSQGRHCLLAVARLVYEDKWPM